jgi:hypothetical protein
MTAGLKLSPTASQARDGVYPDNTLLTDNVDVVEEPEPIILCGCLMMGHRPGAKTWHVGAIRVRWLHPWHQDTPG